MTDVIPNYNPKRPNSRNVFISTQPFMMIIIDLTYSYSTVYDDYYRPNL